MTDVKIHLETLNKDVLVSVPPGTNLKEAFNEVSSYVKTLEANNQISDPEQGINPMGATHVIKKEGKNYRLVRARFSAF